jgi:large subunit ribosomal protein L6
MLLKLEVNDGKVAVGCEQRSLSKLLPFTDCIAHLVNNMVTGVSKGYEKQLELVGVGYRATNTGQQLELSLGFSHNLVFELPKEIEVSTETLRGKNPIITLKSNDKQLIGQVCAKIRAFRTPEPYKGKGIRFVGEIIRRKAGKSSGKKK